jgi:lysophospholipase L1-like esterase
MKTKMIFALVMLVVLSSVLYLAETLTRAEQTKSSNIYDKLASRKSFQYLIVGDSIGRGSGAENKSKTWFQQLERLIKQKYGSSAKRYSVVQSGATAFEGIYKFQEAKLPEQMDLIFIVFGENDRKYMNSDQFAYFYEKLIRQVKKRYPSSEIFTFTESCLNVESFAEEIKKISIYYGATNIDMRVPFQTSTFSTAELTADLIHPNGKGYELYANEVLKTLEKNMGEKRVKQGIPAPLFEDADRKLQSKHSFQEKKGFYRDHGYYIGTRKNDFIEYEFTGPFLGVTVLRNEYGGFMDVYLNDQFYTTISTWWPLEKIRHLYIASDLSEGPHRVKFVVTGEKSLNNATEKADIKISSIIVAEK